MQEIIIETKSSRFTLSTEFSETEINHENKNSIYKAYYNHWTQFISSINKMYGIPELTNEKIIRCKEVDNYKNRRNIVADFNYQSALQTFINGHGESDNSNPNIPGVQVVSNTHHQLYNTQESSFSVTYSLNDGSETVLHKTPIDTGTTEHLGEDIYSLFPQLELRRDCIKVPKKVETTLRKYTPAKMLSDIHPKKNVAIDFCMLFLSKLNSTNFYNIEEAEDHKEDGWKSLHSHILKKEFDYEINTYKKIINALLYEGKKGSILECDGKFIKGEKCFYYRLGKGYIRKGIASYKLKTPDALELQDRNVRRSLANALNNPICNNLIKMYPFIKVPSVAEIEIMGKELIKENFTTKKGKQICSLNKRPRSYYKNCKNLSFIEDSIKLFKFLTGDKFMIPHASGEKNGGRVVDSFTLMPSWIRNMCTINGQPIVEIDYTALHPNIAMEIYGGCSSYITHGDIAHKANIDLSLVKKEHLSFFNKTWDQMMHSPLYTYYWLNEPDMMENIYRDKTDYFFFDVNRYKITSRRMFRKEVEIMSDVIRTLNAEDIYVGYVYDALFCRPDQKQRVQEVMNDVILQHGVKTRAK